MEFTIDLDLLRRIARDEYDQASAEIKQLGVGRAFALTQTRHDDRLESAPDASSLACRAGCSWCCYFRVDVRSAEIMAIADFIDAHIPNERKVLLQRDVAARAKLIESLSEAEHDAQNIPCPFLVDSRCSIYAVRPQTCRNYHSTDERSCAQVFDDPGNEELDPPCAPGVYQSGSVHVDAVSKALRDAGYNIDVYELSTALAAFWTDPDSARMAFDRGKSPVPNSRGFEPPSEFLDLVE